MQFLKKSLPVLMLVAIALASAFFTRVGTSRADDYSELGVTRPVNGADLINGVNYPRVKIITGADGTNSGDVSSTNPMPISSTLVVATPQAMITVLPTALPTAFPTPQFNSAAASLRTFTVDNATQDQEVWCALGGSTTAHFSVPAGAVYSDNLGTRGQSLAAGVACIHPGPTPATGSLKIYGE